MATTQRRKKEKPSPTAVKEEGGPSQPIAIAGAGARGSAFESSSFPSASSVGSASGSDVYSQHSPVAPEPSPSPPSSGINFVHYSHPPPQPGPHGHYGLRNEGRMQFHPSAGPFNPTPSPLSNQPPQQSRSMYRGPDHCAESAMSAASRMATYPYVTTSAMTSSGNSIAPLSSFEREKVVDVVERPHGGAMGPGTPTSVSSADKKYERYTMQR